MTIKGSDKLPDGSSGSKEKKSSKCHEDIAGLSLKSRSLTRPKSLFKKTAKPSSTSNKTTQMEKSIQELTDMGFPAEESQQALLKANNSVNTAIGYLLESNSDPILVDSPTPLDDPPSYNDALVDPLSGSAASDAKFRPVQDDVSYDVSQWGMVLADPSHVETQPNSSTDDMDGIDVDNASFVENSQSRSNDRLDMCPVVSTTEVDNATESSTVSEDKPMPLYREPHSIPVFLPYNGPSFEFLGQMLNVLYAIPGVRYGLASKYADLVPDYESPDIWIEADLSQPTFKRYPDAKESYIEIQQLFIAAQLSRRAHFSVNRLAFTLSEDQLDFPTNRSSVDLMILFNRFPELFETTVFAANEYSKFVNLVLDLNFLEPPTKSLSVMLENYFAGLYWRPIITQLANCFLFTIHTKNDPDTLDIPAEWYPDRYMEHCQDYLSKLQDEYENCLNEQKTNTRELEMLKFYDGFEVNQLIEASIKILDELAAQKDTSEVTFKGMAVASDAAKQSNHSPLALELQKIQERATSRISEIEKSLEDISKEIERIGLRQFAPLHDDPPDTPWLHRYLLSGVLIDHDTVYTLSSSTDLGSTWNKIEFSGLERDVGPLYSVSEVSSDDVLQACRVTGKHTVQVLYTSEKMWEQPADSALGPGLKRFADQFREYDAETHEEPRLINFDD
ncbi:hypothetical protein CANCADRAFT_42107 [Tortispora caseinolytica NRRL Y-17796]|uniref:UBA domain-containing protein n=1 Tax=Tortispora caseinolytica NRRL Y-17796 TaxID=767744 RepID=A0A1E4TI83_9ASCO|nr:hypothetical protein CANCADRAFT_42107 [Tortispora caseinolytica NRRL Y-17796]